MDDLFHSLPRVNTSGLERQPHVLSIFGPLKRESLGYFEFKSNTHRLLITILKKPEVKFGCFAWSRRSSEIREDNDVHLQAGNFKRTPDKWPNIISSSLMPRPQTPSNHSIWLKSSLWTPELTQLVESQVGTSRFRVSDLIPQPANSIDSRVMLSSIQIYFLPTSYRKTSPLPAPGTGLLIFFS